MSALKRVRSTGPGISRRRQGRGFTYVHPNGQTLRDDATRVRIRSLAIPPAWEDVWICPDERGHLQAVGTDAAGGSSTCTTRTGSPAAAGRSSIASFGWPGAFRR